MERLISTDKLAARIAVQVADMLWAIRLVLDRTKHHRPDRGVSADALSYEEYVQAARRILAMYRRYGPGQFSRALDSDLSAWLPIRIPAGVIGDAPFHSDVRGLLQETLQATDHPAIKAAWGSDRVAEISSRLDRAASSSVPGAMWGES